MYALCVCKSNMLVHAGTAQQTHDAAAACRTAVTKQVATPHPNLHIVRIVVAVPCKVHAVTEQRCTATSSNWLRCINIREPVCCSSFRSCIDLFELCHACTSCCCSCDCSEQQKAVGNEFILAQSLQCEQCTQLISDMHTCPCTHICDVYTLCDGQQCL
jgi:hypothetical protein